MHEFVRPNARLPFDRRIEIPDNPKARIGTASTLIPVNAWRGKAFERADAQSFVYSTITFKVPQIEKRQVSHLEQVGMAIQTRRGRPRRIFRR